VAAGANGGNAKRLSVMPGARARRLSDPDIDGEERGKLAYVLQKIWLNAQVCKSRGRDENAWCMDVIQPLVSIAIRYEFG